MEKAQIRPLATPKPLNRSSQKLACMITSWTAPDMQKNFCDRYRGFRSPDTWFCRDFGVTFFLRFLGLFNNPTAYTPKQIFAQSTPEHVVPGKEVPFGGLDNCIWYLDP